MKRIFTLCVLVGLMSFAGKLIGQTTATATWALTSSAAVTSTTANITVGSATLGSGLTATSPAFSANGWTATVWPTSTSVNSSDFIGYTISPTTGNNLIISSLTVTPTTNSTVKVPTYAFYYYVVTTGTAVSESMFGSNATLINGVSYTGTGSAVTVSGFSISVPSGYTCYVRVAAVNVTSGKYFGNLNFSLNGSTISTYCYSTYTTGTGSSDYITNIIYAGINNSTGATSSPYYAYYPSPAASVMQGSLNNFTISVNSGGGNEYVGMWIDLNDDGTFDNSERFINNVQTSSYTLTQAITIPVTNNSTNTAGTHRMRVRISYNTTSGAFDPCVSYTYGETEDYNVTVTAVPACTTPASPSVLTFGTSTTATQAGSFTAPATAPTGYLVVSGTSATAPIPANGTTYMAGATLGTGTVQYVGTSTSFNASSSLTSNTNYYYFIYSYNSDCTGAPYYSTAPATNSKYTCIAAPTALAAGSITSTSASITWTASGGAVTSYDLLYSTTSGGPFTTVSGVTSPYTLSGLSSGTTYYYEIVANNTANTSSCGTSVTSAQASFATLVPRAVGSITATQQATGNITVSSANNNILSIAIPVTGTYGTLTLNSVTVNSANTSDADITASGVKLWIGTSAAPGTQIGTASFSGGTATFSGLSNSVSTAGTYYLWITYDISSTATLGDQIDATISAGGITLTASNGATAPGTQPTSALNPSSYGTIGYCTPSSTGTNTYISNVTTTGGVTNFNNSSGYTTGGYADYTSSYSVSQSQTSSLNYSVTFAAGSNTAGLAIWVDWNHNGIFTDAGENVYNSASFLNPGTYTGTFTVPSGATLGNTLMRVMVDYSNSTPSPCSFSGIRGEAEDYTFTVLAPPSCTAPIMGTPVSVSPTSESIPFTCTSCSPGNAYIVEYGATGFTPGTGATAGTGGMVITGTSSPVTISGLAASTTYDVYIRQNCSVSGNGYSANSAKATFTTVPVNDNCSGAIAIIPGTSCSSTSGTSIGATQQYAPGVCSGSAASAALDVWYKFTADGTSSYTINITGSSSYDAVLQLYSGSCASLTAITCVNVTLAGGAETINAGILAAGTYEYRIYDYNGSNGTFTTCVTYIPACTTPSVPTALTLGTSTTTTQAGSFTAPATAPTGYLVVSSTNSTLSANPVNGTTYTAGTSAIGGGAVQYVGSSTSFIASSLTSNTNYYYFVYSYNSGCSGAPYYSTNAATANKYTCIAAPTGLTAGSVTTSSASISWTSSSGTITSYNFLYSTISGGPFTTISGVNSPYTINGLSGGTTYYYEIVANNTANTSSCGTNAVSIQSSFATVPANDQCSGAQVIPASGPFPYLTTTVDNTSATTTGDPIPTAGSSSPANGVWYSFTPATSGIYTFTTCPSVTATTVSNDEIGIFTGTCGSTYTEIGFNDDAVSPASCSNNTNAAIISQYLSAGTTYSVLVYDYNSSATPGKVQIQVSYNGTCTSSTNTLTVNSGDNVYWSSANWSSGHVPYPCENVQITYNVSGGSNLFEYDGIVNINEPVTINNLTLSSTHSGAGYKYLYLQEPNNYPIHITGNLNMSCTGGGATPNNTIYFLVSTTNCIIDGTATIGQSADTKYCDFGGEATNAASITFNGDVTFNTGGYTSYIGTYTFNKVGTQNFTNNSTQTTTSSPAGTLVNFQNVVVGNSGITNLTIAGTATSNQQRILDGSLTVTPGSSLTLPSGYTFNRTVATSGATGTLSVGSASLLKLAGATGGQTGSNFPSGYTTFTFDPLSTTEYNGTTQQTVFATPTYGNLTITNASANGAIAGGAVNVVTDLLINTGARLSTNSASGYPITVGRNWTNNGMFMPYNGIVMFHSAQNGIITGTSTTAFNKIGINKGTSQSTTLTIAGIVTDTAGAYQLIDTSGLIIINSNASFAKTSTGDIVINSAAAGIYNNSGTFSLSSSGSLLNNGLFQQASGGVTTIGTVAGNSITTGSGGSVIMNGGTISVAGRVQNTAGSFTMNGGTITLNLVGNTAAAGSFDMSISTTVNISGTPLIVFQKAASTVDLNIVSGGTKTITGGTFQFGNSSTPASSIFKSNSGIALYNLSINNTSNNNPTLQLSAPLTVAGTATINTGTTFNINSSTLNLNGPIVNNGLYSGSTTSNLSIAGTEAITGNFNFTSGGIAQNLGVLTVNRSGVPASLGSNLTVNSASSIASGSTFNVNTGSVLGLSAALTNTGLLGVNGSLQLNNSGIVTAAPTYASAATLIYNTTAAGVTTGLEWNAAGTTPGAGIPFNVTIQNTNNVLLAGDRGIGGTLNILSGDALSLNDHTLTLNGAFSGAGKFIGSVNSGLVIGGAAGTVSFTNNTSPATRFNYLKTLTLSSAASNITLGDTLNIASGTFASPGTVTIATAGGNLHAGNKLVLKSSSLGDARIAVSAGTISDSVVVERFIPARRAWRFITAPVNTSQTINKAWQEGSPANTDIYTHINPHPGFGTEITYMPDNALGFDINTTTTPSIKYWDSSVSAWVPPISTYTALNSHSAWCLFVRGSRAVDLSLARSAPPDTTVLRAKGVLNETNGAPVVTNYTAVTGSYLFIGNPYASPISILSALSHTSGINQTKFYVWDPEVSGNYGVGAYVSYSGSLSVPNGSTYSGSTYAQSGQGFFVQATSSGTVTTRFQQGDKSNTESSVNKVMTAPPAAFYTNLMTPTGDSLVLIDGVGSAFGNGYSAAVDTMDANKRWNFEENIALARDTSRLAIEFRPVPVLTDTLFYKLFLRQNQPYALKIFARNIPAGFPQAWLVDRYLNTKTAFNTGDTLLYNFTPNTDTSSYRSRFILVFKRTLTATPVSSTFSSVAAEAKSLQSGLTVYPNPAAAGSKVLLKFSNMKKDIYEVTVNSIDGKALSKQTIDHQGGSYNYELQLDARWTTGNYIIKATGTSGYVGSTKLVVGK